MDLDRGSHRLQMTLRLHFTLHITRKLREPSSYIYAWQMYTLGAWAFGGFDGFALFGGEASLSLSGRCETAASIMIIKMTR